MAKIFRFLILCFLFMPLAGFTQTYYWVSFTDKAGNPYSLDKPSEYLSERAIQRRQKYNIPIDESDLPVNPDYIKQVLDLGATYIHSSKWLNGVTVMTDSTDFEERVNLLPFVDSVQVTKRILYSGKSLKNKFAVNNISDNSNPIDSSKYGSSVYQVGQINGQYLHNQNYLGQGMQIAVLDAGFYHADINPAFDSLWVNGQILGTKDFVDPSSNVFEEFYHGMSVLSIMGGNIPGELIGTAPKASYWLIRSEDAPSENIIEEDNWVAAAEYADSVGADIINSSLGYYLFDDSTMNHTYADMNGHTTRVTRGANMAVSKGMLVFASAGNEGNDPWKYIIAPSDGDNVIGVGAVDRYGTPAPFTSYGPASDGDVKPNITCVGWNTIVEQSNGSVKPGSGTSYSSPVMAGMAACLWQANPEATPLQVKGAIEQGASLYNNPDSLMGYGIPDFQLADQILKLSVSDMIETNSDWFIYPNPFTERIVIFQQKDSVNSDLVIDFLDISGRLLKQLSLKAKPVMVINQLNDLPSGLIILMIKSENETSSHKLIKQ